jgi:hypothetical protein
MVVAALSRSARAQPRWGSDNAQEQSGLVLGRLHHRCWNGEAVQVLFSFDCCDREVMGWLATSGGVSG